MDLRPAGPTDGPFLAEMVAAAAFWGPDGPTGSVREVMARPELSHYVAGWTRPGDRGVVAEDARPVGAAWIRLFPEGDPGYSFVDAETSEVSIGVAQGWRGRGVGSRLLDALLAQARGAGLRTLSLSVDPDNYAACRYERLGFQPVGGVGGSVTMLLRL